MANSMILGSIEVIAEALTFAEKSGIGSDRVFDLVKGEWDLSILNLSSIQMVT